MRWMAKIGIRGIRCRATIPAIEALIRAGNRVTMDGAEVGLGAVMQAAQLAATVAADGQDMGYVVYLTRPPKDMVRVDIRTPHAQGGWTNMPGLRMSDEPPFPAEAKASWYDRLDAAPCPKCGRALLWAEAGYVPGWRVCAGGGHFSSDPDSTGKPHYEGKAPEGSQYHGLKGIEYID